jgi:hypothetical protein
MPWISRRDLDRLYALIDKLTDHKVRSERVEAELHETPTPAKQLLGPMPDLVRDWIDSHEGDKIRSRLRKEAFSAAKEVGSWDAVVNQLQQEAGNG